VPVSPTIPNAQSSAPIDVRRVRTLFSSPQSIDESDFLRREIAGRMQERLALVKIAPQRILDAGCGDGPDLQEPLLL
jgi:malonyl-CoA O-methyltransferase